MDAVKLAGLSPASVMGYFEKICSIPHGSGNTKGISDYLVSFAREQGLRYIQDENNNVIIFQNGTPGYEDHPPVILQGHMDMVCEKETDCPIDMQSQGVDVTHNGEIVYANGTTLGGDNGIAVAYALALLADKSIPHPPLEILLTVDEEVGMLGAASVDTSAMKGRLMINIDTATEGNFTVSCAGGATVAITLPVSKHAVYGPCVRLMVDDLQGGHSGSAINKNRANANMVMGELLSRIQKVMPFCLTSLNGGAKDNAIPRSCEATLVMLGMDAEPINAIIADLQQEIRDHYDEPEATIIGENVDALGGNALSTEDTAKVISMLCTIPNGVHQMSQDIPGLVQTSSNFAIAKLTDALYMTVSARSGVNKEKEAFLEKLQEWAKFNDADIKQVEGYPAWEYKKDSHLRETMVKVYEEMYGKSPRVVAIHAGLECGLLSGKLPGLDCVSIGPNMYDLHTPRERFEIASVERTWNFLLETLKNL